MVDAEQAELIEAAVAMLEAALRSRSKRRDPDQIISNSLILQGNKLATVRQLLAMPEPPDWPNLEPGVAAKAIRAMRTMLENSDAAKRTAAWKELRALAIAPGFPGA